MSQEVSHVYFVPGMAADVSIFEYIKLPKDKFVTQTLPWKIPNKNESIEDYAKRMCEEIEHKNCILIGVSFGGVMVQEMSKYLILKKLVIISSVKNKFELPTRIKIARKTKAYKLLPTAIVSKIDNWEKLAFGDFAKKRAAMYQKYLSINDKRYLDWAIENMVCWDQEKTPDNLVHIHGDKDIVFPISNIKKCITVDGGTHVMIVNRARWFNKNLPEIISDNLR
ncbi:esterase/lipase [Aquimarina sp. EL_43]|uniref:alpha/beta hydrolase n=1 Tax=unclassified Aquimarina TaxID=2627091 RepID=UPI0018C909F2|nr:MULTISPECIES: alpha/beta hydrolase [unclassified Aquimarina]MBG6130530.1 esterase/lipase [Aquimarina sp. EL_35]MBG6151324.1 esterase/lipase [Aquimarina sp. EL_32]MBG6168932.1 esterase/lipase [Aquimarina sp. EL_43]